MVLNGHLREATLCWVPLKKKTLTWRSPCRGARWESESEAMDEKNHGPSFSMDMLKDPAARDQMAVGPNQWYHFGVGAPPILGFILVGIGMFTGVTGFRPMAK